jgi:cytochrome P450
MFAMYLTKNSALAPAMRETTMSSGPKRLLEEPPEPRTWLPWGGGRKHCLGRYFALLEMETVLQQVLAAMRVFPASTDIEQSQWRSATLVPRAGGRIVLRRRSTARAACGARSKVY